MKRLRYTLIPLLFPLLSAAQGAHEYYYYYRGEKQYLALNTSYLFISLADRVMPRIDSTFPVAEGCMSGADSTPRALREAPQVAGYYWEELRLNAGLDHSSYQKLLRALQAVPGVRTVSPYFRSRSAEKIGLSSFFYVKLRGLSDTALLRRFAARCHCRILRQDRYMPRWFALSVSERSSLNALEAANAFYESGLFEAAEPDFLLEDVLHRADDTPFAHQWELKNVGQYGGLAGVDIKVCDAWRLSRGAGVVVAILDQGIDTRHPDL